jgi:hypothetical protein
MSRNRGACAMTWVASWAAAVGVLCSRVSAAEPPQPTVIEAAAVARAAGHPGPLHVAPESTSELAKGFGTPLWAVGIESPDGSFGHVSVLLVHRGTFLTKSLEPSLAAAAAAPEQATQAIREDMQGQIERAHAEKERTRLTLQLREVEEITAKGPITQRLALPNDRVGYGTMLGFSAGGATFVTALPSPDDQYELLVATGASLEGEKRTPNDKSAAYEQAMREHPLQVSEAIAQVVYKELFGGAERKVEGSKKDEGSKAKDEGSKVKDDARQKSPSN